MKKALAVILSLIGVLSILSACKPQNQNQSSELADSEYSQNISEAIDSENSKEIGTGSKTASVSTSSGIKNTTVKESTLEIGAYHFNPLYTTNYGEYSEITPEPSNLSNDKRLEEIDDVLSEGYFNTIFLEIEHFDDEQLWKLIEKHDLKVWFLVWKLYKSENTTLEKYMESFDKKIENIRKNPDWWSRFNGFAYDESVHRGQSVEDFNAVCEYFYKKYGKRNFPVFALNEISDLADAPGLGEMNQSGFKYVTDVAFDVYTVDVRDGAPEGNEVKGAKKVYSDIKDGKSYYEVITKEMVKMAAHPVNVWFYPSAQVRSISGGLGGIEKSDEGFCIGHLKFFDELLNKQEHPGGMIIYTYAQWNIGEYGLQSHLSVKDENGKQKIRRYEYQVWHDYSNLLKDLTQKYRNKKVNLVLDPTKQ